MNNDKDIKTAMSELCQTFRQMYKRYCGSVVLSAEQTAEYLSVLQVAENILNNPSGAHCEYQYLVMSPDELRIKTSMDTKQGQLNRMGDDGWELCAIDFNYYYFKRLMS